MEEYYNQKVLALSKPYRDNFNDDAFELFEIHYPHLYQISPTGYRLIFKDVEKTTPSLYNKLGTNYTAYTYVVNQSIEKMLETGEINHPSKVNPLVQIGYDMIINYLKNNKEFFTSLLPEIGNIIKKRTEAGDKAEIGSEEVLKRIFGKDIEIRQTAGLGQKEDTHGGKDRVIVKNGKALNVQIKKSGKIEESNGVYYINHLGAKLYPNVDIIIFNRGDWYFAFRAKFNGLSTLQILGDREGYMIPSQYKIMITKLEPTKNI